MRFSWFSDFVENSDDVFRKVRKSGFSKSNQKLVKFVVPGALKKKSQKISKIGKIKKFGHFSNKNMDNFHGFSKSRTFWNFLEIAGFTDFSDGVVMRFFSLKQNSPITADPKILLPVSSAGAHVELFEIFCEKIEISKNFENRQNQEIWTFI